MNRRGYVCGFVLLLHGCGDDAQVVGEMASGGTGGGTGSTSTNSGPGGSGSGGSSSGGTNASATSGSGGTSATSGAGGTSTTSGSGSTSTTSGSGGSSTTSGAGGSSTTSGAGGAAECADGEVWCPGCNDGEGFCSVGGCPAAACVDCSSLSTEADCATRSDCHPVFEDPGTCGCAAIGCCARFAFCAVGATADCEGFADCEAPEPFCEDPAFVISYAGNCYEGCVRPEECAGSGGTSTTGSGTTSSSTSTGSGGAGEVCPCEPDACAEDEQLCLQGDQCLLATGPIGNGLCRSGDGTCFYCECASPDTPIATANGERPIRDLAVGDLVYSVHDGAIRLVPIRQVNRVPVTEHRVLRIEFASGAHFEMSAGHPTAQGRPIADLAVGQAILGERVTSITEIAYRHPYTYDILPDSDSGSYFADGVLVGSTLQRRTPNVSSSW